MTFDLVLVGFGRVARRFVALLDEQRDALARDHDITTRVVETVTRRPDSVAALRMAVRAHADAARRRRLVVVEATTLDIERGEPATSHVRAALKGGAHVITVNKGPAAFAFHELSQAAARADRQFRFEGSVMDGVPVFNCARELLPAITITGFRGVVNSTTNYIITAMEHGDSFESALAAMQRAGIAEADASLDIDGWDAAAKAAALANALLGARITPHDVEREGLSAASAEAIRLARATGRRVKLVATARGRGSRAHARVALLELPELDLLAGLDGPQNAIVLETDLLGDVAIVELGSGLTQTAYALLGDLVSIARAVRSGRRATPRSRPRAPRGGTRSGRGRR
ncbi:MAG TPA: homoserine dehydrogenase [Vicinamibacterales bacterium]|nr:homoserine dehydrogenase [Vicinamibacterales bacterium]